MSRRELRDVAVRFIFQYDFQNKEELGTPVKTEKKELDEMLENFITSVYDDEADAITSIKNSEEYGIYLEPVVMGVLDNLSDIDGYIARNSLEWEFSRIGKMDLAILRVAVYELLKRPDIPEVVTINEAIELSKKYSSEKAGVFINGVLGGIFTEIDDEKING